MKSYEPIIVAKEKDGKILLTEEELSELLKKAYDNGYAEGMARMPIITQPTNPAPNPYTPPSIPVSPTYPNSPFWWSGPTCTGTNSGLVGKEGVNITLF